MKEILKKCLVEFVGTFFIMFTFGAALFPNSNNAFPPLAIAFIVIAVVYMGKSISGAQYNPAISLADSIRGKLSWKHLLPYVIVQFIAAAFAAYVLSFIIVVPPYSNETTFNIKAMFACEFLFTFLLTYTYLQTVNCEKTKGNSYYGLAIGSVILAAFLATAGTSYGVFNPAIALALIVMGLAQIKLVVFTIIANIIAGAAAAGIYKITSTD